MTNDMPHRKNSFMLSISSEEQLRINDFNCLKTRYIETSRDRFKNGFQSFYCCVSQESKVKPVFDKIFKADCFHDENNKSKVMELKRLEIITYVKNILTWTDAKLQIYNTDDSTSKYVKPINTKNCYIKVDQEITRFSLLYKLPEFNNDSVEQNCQLKSVMYDKNNVVSSIKTSQKSDGSAAAEDKDIFSNIDTLENVLQENVNYSFNNNNKQHTYEQLTTEHTDKIMDDCLEIEVNNLLNEMPLTSPKHVSRMLTSGQEAAIDEIYKHLKVDDILTDDSSKNEDVENITISNIDESNSNIKINTSEITTNNAIATYEKKLDTDQLSSDGENISDMYLDTSSTTVKCLNNSVNKQFKRKLTPDKMFKKNLRSSSSGKRLNKSLKTYEFCSKRKKVKDSSFSHEVEDVDINSLSDTEQSVIIGINDVEENTNNNSSAFIKFSNSSNSSITEKLYTDKKIELNTKNEDLPTPRVSSRSMTSKLEKTSKQNIKEKSNPVKVSNSLKKKTDTNMYTRKTKGDAKMQHDDVLDTTIDIKNENNLTAGIVNCSSMTSNLKTIPKQNVENVKVSNDSTKKIDKNMYSRNKKGETKMHAACAKGDLTKVKLLLSSGFNPNVRDNAGWSPMHEAVKKGHSEVVKELINYGAYLNAPGFEYETPLHTAIKYDQFEIATILMQNGAVTTYIDIRGDNAYKVMEDRYFGTATYQKWLFLLENQKIQCSLSKIDHTYELDQIFVFLNNVSLNNADVRQFCQQFNIKLIHSIRDEIKFTQVTHIIVPETENNTCDVNLECLTGIANGLFIVNQNWVTESLNHNKLMNCENYEVNGTKTFVDCNGPKTSRIQKEKLNPKLFDGINIHVSGNNGFGEFSVEQLKKLVVEFGAKLLKRMPNPEDCPTDITPYYCRENKQMYHVSNIILYTTDSNRLIKYNMEHLKAFHISWFMECAQKHTII